MKLPTGMNKLSRLFALFLIGFAVILGAAAIYLPQSNGK
jgi:hypothetical protein